MTDTYVAATPGEKMLVEIETATPGTYAAPATITLQRSLELTASIEKALIPNATNPSAPGYNDGTATGLDWKISGQGTLNVGDEVTWANWWVSGARKNVRVSNALTGGIVFVGPALVASLSLTSDGIGKKVQGSISLEGAGLPTITTHA